VNQELQKKALNGETPITVRPADLIKPELEKLKKEIPLKNPSIEDVLTYALFPKVALKFFNIRDGLEEAPKTASPKKEVRKKELREASRYKVTVEGTSYDVIVQEGDGSLLNYTPEQHPPHASLSGTPQKEGEKIINAPLAGRVLRMSKKTGEVVHTGDVVLVIEAMKMETEIKAIHNGKLSRTFVKEGEEFALDTPLYGIISV